MRKPILLALSSIALCQLSFADTCPTVESIRNNEIKEWKAFDCEDNTPLSAKRLSDFKKGVEAFALAEWVQDKKTPGGAVHCYYRSKNGSDLDAYLSRNNYTPDNQKNLWYQVSGAMQCAAGSEKCLFQPSQEPTQLANQPEEQQPSPTPEQKTG